MKRETEKETEKLLEAGENRNNDHGKNPKFDGGYKQALSKKKEFIHFMQKYVKAEWCEGLTPEQVELCGKEMFK